MLTTITEALQSRSTILAECAIAERLRRMDDIELHPLLFNTPLIYQQRGRKRMEEIYGEYRQVALDAKLPILLYAPTWRVDRKRILLHEKGPLLNRDAVGFMRKLQEKWQHPDSPIFLGGLLGPKNDCYIPEESLVAHEAKDFHSYQIQELVEAGVDCILAQTMPALSEALGMAQELSERSTPYLISFVIDSGGKLLDSTPLIDAIKTIDQETQKPPTGYMVNCVYPTSICADKQPMALFDKLIGIQANSSSKSHDQLDGSSSLQQDSLQDWGEQMIKLNRDFGVKILGGCCGTDTTYLRYIADSLSEPLLPI